MSLNRFVRQLNPIQEKKVNYVDVIQDLQERVDTTLNASITELFPALAFNTGSKPSNANEMASFVNNLNLEKGETFHKLFNETGLAKTWNRFGGYDPSQETKS